VPTLARPRILPNDRKPSGLRLNPAHPLARDLVFAALFDQPGGVPYDLIRGLGCAASGTIGRWGVGLPVSGVAISPPRSRWGPGMVWQGGTTDYLTFTNPNVLGIDRDCTLVVHMGYVTNASVGTYGNIFTLGFAGLRRQTGDNRLEAFYVRQSDGAYYRIGFASALPTGTDFQIAMVVRGDNVENVYLDGFLWGAGPGTFWFSSTAFRNGNIVLGGNSGDTSMDGIMYAALAYKRALGVDELKALTDAPWRMCTPTLRRRVAAVSGHLLIE
jgi:hypothetical protein